MDTTEVSNGTAQNVLGIACLPEFVPPGRCPHHGTDAGAGMITSYSSPFRRSILRHGAWAGFGTY